MMYSLIKPLLFKLDAEKAHYLSLDSLKFFSNLPFHNEIIQAIFDISSHNDTVELFGLKFKNRVGLAAGLDKNASYYHELANLGFGFIEVGTVTPKAQSGNDKPRLFRLIKDQAIQNRMGFNNDGVFSMKEKLLQRKRKDIIIGGNIGKNKITPNEEAITDYIQCLKELHSVVDYFVVNVSSPNTPGLRELQDKEPLTQLLKEVQKVNQELGAKPLLLKIAPDLENEQLQDIIQITEDTKLSGLIATNTTIDRNRLIEKRQSETNGAGGISGKPLTKRSTEVIQFIHRESNGKIPIIGVGGIMNGKDAKEKLDAGASLIQLYTGFIYAGPSLVKECIKALRVQKK